MTATVSRQVAVSLLAHPDDAEILCAGTLIRLAAMGWRIHIATATAGDCGTTSETAEQISRTRKSEAMTAAALIDATYHCMDEGDANVVYDRLTIRKTIDLFRELAPTLVFTHAPHDYMVDHEVVSVLARNASFAFPMPNASTLPLAEGSAVPHLYYCDPVEGVDPFGHSVQPTTFVDISRELDQKKRMLACHRSQRQWLRDHHGMDECVDAMLRQAANRGSESGVSHAEAFVQHRGHGYPRNDLLQDLFGSRSRG